MDENVCYDENKGIITAKINGRLEYRNNTVAIKDTIIIHGNVGPKSGNINFSGYVKVIGDIKDGYSIKAERGINITGRAGACHLESDGNINIESVYDSHKGTIKCGGDFTTRLAYIASIQSLGNINILSESLGSTLKSRGTVDASEGTIAGGTCIALKGIEVSNLGGDSNLLTKIYPGMDFLIIDHIQKINDMLEEIEKNLDEISRMLGPVTEKLSKEEIEELPEKKKENVISLLDDKEKLESHKTQLVTELKSITEKNIGDTNKKINIRKVLHPGAIINIDQTSRLITKIRKGPISAIEKPAGGIIFLPYTSLKKNAEMIKNQLLIKVDK